MLTRRHAVSTAFGRGVRESGIHALHSAGMCCRYVSRLAEASHDNARLTKQPSATLGLHGDAFARFPSWGAGYQPAVRYGNRTRDSQIHSLVLCQLS